MEKIASFQVDHDKLERGIYVSRIDEYGGVKAVTFDIRMKKPNMGDYLTTTSAHTIEHLGATYLRSSDIKDRVVYFGPMGCRTGFYVIFFGDITVEEAAKVITGMFEFILSFEGDIPGAKREECGNYEDLELSCAKEEAEKYLEVLHNLTYETMHYQG
ncbi:MAG: S-ribosylhomocysteine lyase [Eubacteriaceae bacterium]|nr:S-ribosylhomocysteine lyase [Eubacteriaceae bacterium]